MVDAVRFRRVLMVCSAAVRGSGVASGLLATTPDSEVAVVVIVAGGVDCPESFEVVTSDTVASSPSAL